MPKLKNAEQTQTQDALNKKAKRAGAYLAKIGGFPPTDEHLESKFGKEGIVLYKKFYFMHRGTDEEQITKSIVAAAKQRVWQSKTLPSDEFLTKKYSRDEINIYKETYSACDKSRKERAEQKKKKLITEHETLINFEDSTTQNTSHFNINNNILKKKAYRAGLRRAARGGSLPTDETLESRFGKEEITTYKESYSKHSGSEQEQAVKRVKQAAKDAVWRGDNLLSDEKLEKKYKEDEIKIYKKIYLKHSKSRKEHVAQRKKNSSHNAPITDCEETITPEATPHDYTSQLNTKHSTPPSIQKYVFPPLDILNQYNHPLFLNHTAITLNSESNLAMQPTNKRIGSTWNLPPHKIPASNLAYSYLNQQNVPLTSQPSPLEILNKTNESNGLLFNYDKTVSSKGTLGESSQTESTKKNTDSINKVNMAHSISFDLIEPIPSPFDVLKKM